MRRSLFFLAVALMPMGCAFGADGDLVSSFFRGGNQIEALYRHSPRSATSDGQTSTVMNMEGIRANLRMLEKGQDVWTFQQSASHLNLTEAPRIITTGLQIPDSLWDVQTGVGFSRKLDERRDVGVQASVGTASNKPYHSLQEMVGRVTASYRVPSGERNSWIWLLAYSNNRTFLNNVPLPGFAYLWRSADSTVTVIAGFPFAAFTYMPSRDRGAQFSMFGPRATNAEFFQRVAGPAKTYARFEWTQDEWARANRNDNRNRLVYTHKRASVGVRSPIGKGFSIDVSGGREFDRAFFENRSSSSSDVQKVTLDNDWIAESKVSWRWGNPQDRR